uniref:Uncharacterized protein n=1 Tax=Clastoptera arizonana TaxID=38151 RepID=A0A1B6E362_9HEMI
MFKISLIWLTIIYNTFAFNILNRAAMIKNNIFKTEKLKDTLEAAGDEIEDYDLTRKTKLYDLKELLSDLKVNQEKGSQEASQKVNFNLDCGIEWENCNDKVKCCEPLYCSFLPNLPDLEALAHNMSTIEVTQMCSTVQSTVLQDLKDNKTNEYWNILELYKNKMLDVLKS